MNVLILKPQQKEYMMVKGIIQQTPKQKEELQKLFQNFLNFIPQEMILDYLD